MANPGLGLEILKTGEFSDFIIECQGIQFRVHRNVICRGSPILYNVCAGSFKVSHGGSSANGLFY